MALQQSNERFSLQSVTSCGLRSVSDHVYSISDEFYPAVNKYEIHK